jgi:hypothetical protein
MTSLLAGSVTTHPPALMFLCWRVLIPPTSTEVFFVGRCLCRPRANDFSHFANIHYICLLLVFFVCQIHFYYLYLNTKIKYVAQPHKTN